MTLRAFQCFAAGDHTDASGRRLQFDEGTLAFMAAAYSPAIKVAPLVVGHPSEADTKPQGEVQCLVAAGRSLFAVADVGPDLMEAVRMRAYSHVSASFWPPGVPGNPLSRNSASPAFYLRHIGFLGAMPPAVKGMQPLAFSGGKYDLRFTFSRELQEEADAVSFAESEAGDGMLARWQLHRAALDLSECRPDLSYTACAVAIERGMRNARSAVYR